MTVTRFDGVTLPAGWTAVTPADTSVVVAGGYAELSVDPGQTKNSLFNSGTVPQGPYIWTAVTGSWDYAATLAEECIDLPDQGLDLMALHSATIQGVRAACFRAGTPSTFRDDRGFFVFHRWGLTNTAGTRATVSHTDTLGGELYGGPGWFRLSYDQPSTTYTYRASMDGRTWYTIASWVSEVPADRFAIHATATPSGTSGRVQRISAVVDMTGRGDDATTPPPAVARTVVQSTDFAAGTLPAWLTPDVANGGAVNTSTGGATLSTDRDQQGSRAWLLGPDTLAADHGILLKYRVASTGYGNVFWVPSIRVDSVTDIAGAVTPDDKYGPGTSMIFELPARVNAIAGQIIRLLRRSPIAQAETQTGGREFDGYTMLIERLTGEVSTEGQPTTWVRLEAIGQTVRGRVWYDGDPEPDAWQYQVEDHMRLGTQAAITMSHNDDVDDPGSASVTISQVVIYELAEATDSQAVNVYVLTDSVEEPVDTTVLISGIERPTDWHVATLA